MSDDDRRSYATATACYCCSIPFSTQDEQRKKVRDHCRITGRYRGAACNRCNKDYLNIIAASHPIPIVFQNLTGYDMHHVMTSLEGRGVQIMATTSERIITANVIPDEMSRGIKYIDSLSFMSASLAELAKDLPDERLIAVKEFIVKKFPALDAAKSFTLLRKKGVYPYDRVDNLSKIEETSLPGKEAFYNELNDEDISDVDYKHAKEIWNFFSCRTFKEYHELYLQTDVLLLADVFESFQHTSLEYYGFDPAWYISLPASGGWQGKLFVIEIIQNEKGGLGVLPRKIFGDHALQIGLERCN